MPWQQVRVAFYKNALLLYKLLAAEMTPGFCVFFFVKLNSGVVLDRLPCSSAHPFKVVKLIYLVANEGWNPLLNMTYWWWLWEGGWNPTNYCQLFVSCCTCIFFQSQKKSFQNLNLEGNFFAPGTDCYNGARPGVEQWKLQVVSQIVMGLAINSGSDPINHIKKYQEMTFLHVSGLNVASIEADNTRSTASQLVWLDCSPPQYSQPPFCCASSWHHPNLPHVPHMVFPFELSRSQPCSFCRMSRILAAKFDESWPL